MAASQRIASVEKHLIAGAGGGTPLRISSHVLDTAQGHPAEGVRITLYAVPESPDGMGGDGQQQRKVGEGVTNADGRVGNLVPPELASSLGAGHYQVTFALKNYFESTGVDKYFFPKATIDFLVTADSPHYHVPLLLNPFGFSTYRGS